MKKRAQIPRKTPRRLPGNDGRARGITSATTSAKVMNEAATTRSPAWYPVSASSTRRTLPRCPEARSALLLERRHGQTEVAELGPVQLRRLALTRPDDRLAGVVDAVRERHPLV